MEKPYSFHYILNLGLYISKNYKKHETLVAMKLGFFFFVSEQQQQQHYSQVLISQNPYQSYLL